MILPNKDKRTASVAIILRKLKGNDYEDMRENNSHGMEGSGERREYHPMGEKDAKYDMNEAETEKLAPIAHKVMMALKQDDARAFASYMMDLIRMCK